MHLITDLDKYILYKYWTISETNFFFLHPSENSPSMVRKIQIYLSMALIFLTTFPHSFEKEVWFGEYNKSFFRNQLSASYEYNEIDTF